MGTIWNAIGKWQRQQCFVSDWSKLSSSNVRATPTVANNLLPISISLATPKPVLEREKTPISNSFQYMTSNNQIWAHLEHLVGPLVDRFRRGRCSARRGPLLPRHAAFFARRSRAPPANAARPRPLVYVVHAARHRRSLARRIPGLIFTVCRSWNLGQIDW